MVLDYKNFFTQQDFELDLIFSNFYIKKHRFFFKVYFLYLRVSYGLFIQKIMVVQKDNYQKNSTQELTIIQKIKSEVQKGNYFYQKHMKQMALHMTSPLLESFVASQRMFWPPKSEHFL